MADPKHWDELYTNRPSDRLSWYRPHLDLSLDLIQRSVLSSGAAIIDVGGGSSTLVDDLLQMGYTNLRVLDISAIPLKAAKERLGDRASGIVWLEGDIVKLDLGESSIDLWHDRAVFHFLTEQSDREAYVRSASRSVKPRGIAIIATFAPEGPSQCSGLPVVRYSADELANQFPAFQLLESASELHTTPSNTIQKFTYVLMQRK